MKSQPYRDSNRDQISNQATTSPSSDLRFGWGKFCPEVLQRLNTPRWFVVFAFVSVLIGRCISNSITFVSPNSIEKQFGITSLQIAALSVAFNISLAVSSFFIGHYGRVDKPRWISLGLLLMSLGAVIGTLPKFMMEKYTFEENSSQQFCSNHNSTSEVVSPVEESKSLYLVVFVIGYIVHGTGAPAIWTLIPSHIEEVMDRKGSSLYIGIYQSVLLAFAPAMAFLIGKPLLTEWVDIFQVGYFISNISLTLLSA